MISTLLGTKLPGPGPIYVSQSLHFERPVAIGDRMTVTVTVTAKEAERHRVSFDCQCTNQRGEVVISGQAEVIAPTTKVKRPRTTLPEVHLHEHGVLYHHLIDLTAGLKVKVAVDRSSAAPGREVRVTPEVVTAAGLTMTGCQIYERVAAHGRGADAAIRLAGPGSEPLAETRCGFA